jgi:hypothetical protein
MMDCTEASHGLSSIGSALSLCLMALLLCVMV